MAENLKTTRYNDGSKISYVFDDYKWTNMQTGAFRWYNHNDAFKDLYGALYNWYTVSTEKLCPSGWHVPSDGEWMQLEMELGMNRQDAMSWGDPEFPGLVSRGTDQGDQLKTIVGWNDWNGIEDNGTNSSGFSALPAGETGWGGAFQSAGHCGSYWTETEYWEAGICRCLGSSDSKVLRTFPGKNIGLSIRCVKD